jgi:hypothetical protein
MHSKRLERQISLIPQMYCSRLLRKRSVITVFRNGPDPVILGEWVQRGMRKSSSPNRYLSGDTVRGGAAQAAGAQRIMFNRYSIEVVRPYLPNRAHRRSIENSSSWTSTLANPASASTWCASAVTNVADVPGKPPEGHNAGGLFFHRADDPVMIRFQVQYMFLVLAHERRRILHFGVTAHLTAEWAAQLLCETLPWKASPRLP